MSKTYYKQGIFIPRNKEKFKGTKATYRSSYELKFFHWADKNVNVLEWGSENVVIPYVSPIDKRVHRYFIDNWVVLKEGTKIKKYLVEIKPKKQTVPPTFSARKKNATIIYEQSMWAVNSSKWESAKKYALLKGYEFIIITEDDLFI